MLHFAVAGVPTRTPKPGGTVEGLAYAASIGITAMELEWVQRVPERPERMAEIREASERLGMYLTVHAPYFVNLNAQEPEKLEASIKRVMAALRMAELAGAHSVCVHPAFYLGMEPSAAYDNVRSATDRIMTLRAKEGISVNLAFETMGKPSQFGTLEEVLLLSKEFGIYPTLDPAHMHARSNGEWNTTAEWNRMFDVYAEHLGEDSLRTVHMHYSGIAYGAKGEKHHLPLEESDANWRDFLKVLHDRNIQGTVVCESPLLEIDTLLLSSEFAKMR